MTAALLALALAASPLPDPRATLEAVCRTHASDPKNPWALAHGIIAFGPTFKARDGRLAADVIVHDFARGDPSAPGHYTFPQFERGEPVDPHPNHAVATLLDSGLPLSTRFPHEGGGLTLGQLVSSIEERADATSLSRDWPSSAWTLEVLAKAKAPQLSAVLPLALAHLEAQQAFLGGAMEHGVVDVPKQHQGIWSEPCGGLHFIEAVMAAARALPDAERTLASRLQAQRVILFWRPPVERRAYEQALAEAPPELVVAVLEQELKFYGHWLEAIGRMERDGQLIPDRSQRASIRDVRRLLADAVEGLKTRGAFANLTESWHTNPQLALDLTGDSCHALQGLALTQPRPE